MWIPALITLGIGGLLYASRSSAVAPGDMAHLRVGDRLRGTTRDQTVDIEVIANQDGKVFGKVLTGGDAGKGPVDVDRFFREVLAAGGTVTKI